VYRRPALETLSVWPGVGGWRRIGGVDLYGNWGVFHVWGDSRCLGFGRD
jgi:hypothetical protein